MFVQQMELNNSHHGAHNDLKRRFTEVKGTDRETSFCGGDLSENVSSPEFQAQICL